MKKEELMINDWIILNGEPKQVMEILFDSITIDCYPIELDYIEPIPLTPEMLDRNGFTNTGGGTYTKMFNGEHCLIYVGFKYHTIDALMSFGNTKRNEVSLNNCGMYLHELQHVLRLCGIKKEIVP